jgi:RNA polymerase sigma factor (sigma-70 family)
MIDLTIEQIRAAADNDLNAITDVLAALEPRIGQLATKHATNGGTRNADMAEDMAQIGRIRAWKCLETFQGATVGEFFAYVDKYVSGDMGAHRREETRQGVSESTASRFERCLAETGGDPYAAEREASRVDGMLGRERLTKEMAHIARLAWQGVARLNAPVSTMDDSVSLGDLLADTLGMPEDLIEAADIDRERRHAVRDAVHATLARMGSQQAFLLRATYGIEPVPHMEHDSEIAEALGIAASRVTVIRWKAKDRFRALYLAGAAATPEMAVAA